MGIARINNGKGEHAVVVSRDTEVVIRDTEVVIRDAGVVIRDTEVVAVLVVAV
jgi:hypothetical protein